jgi:hypothetical protein
MDLATVYKEWKKYKHAYGSYLVFVANRDWYQVFDKDADYCSDLFGWKIVKGADDSRLAGCPDWALHFRKELLRSEPVKYLIVDYKDGKYDIREKFEPTAKSRTGGGITQLPDNNEVERMIKASGRIPF